VIFVLAPVFAEGDKETAIPALVSEACGVVLEIGPGTGSQLPRYDVSKITKVYGVEPNVDLHKDLREKVKASGLTDIYEIVPCGVEDAMELKKHGIALGSIDAVLSIQVLCSVPDLDDTLRLLYALMKPEGQFIVYEHVKSNDVVSAMVQSMFDPSLIVTSRWWWSQRADIGVIDLYSIIWPLFIGNCHLNRNTQQSIMKAGDWGKIELTVPTSEDASRLFPRIYGRLGKK
jgi:SAM-dependent methyltransferase